jgi:6-phosphofructokinase 1
LSTRGHAVIAVTEEAGRKFFPSQSELKKDASGKILHKDIGQCTADGIKVFFKEKKRDPNLKYLDPSHIIRGEPTNSTDRVFRGFLDQKAARAAMAGKTDCLIGQWNDHFVRVPISMAIKERKKVDPMGELWNSVLERTGQPSLTAES